MYIHPDIKREAEEKLGRDLPHPNEDAFDELVLELQHSDPELADKLQSGVIFEGVGDPKHAALKAERRAETKKGFLKRFFMRPDELTGEPVVAKKKGVMAAVLALCLLFGAGYFVNQPRAAAQTETPDPVEEVRAPEPIAEPEVTKEPNDALIAARSAFGPDLPPAPLASLAAPAAPAPDEELSGPAPSGVLLSPTLAQRGSAVVARTAPSEPFISQNDSPRASGVIKGSGGARSSGVIKAPVRYTSSNARVSSSPAKAQTREVETATTLSNTSLIAGTQTPQTRFDAPMPDAELAGPASSDTATLQASQVQELSYRIGDTISGEAATGFLAAEGNSLPALIETEDGAVWRGEASLNELGRVEVTLNEVHRDGVTESVTASVYSLDDFPGIEAEIREETPALAADLVTAGLRGVTDYVQDLSDDRSAIATDQGVFIDESVVPLEWSVAGSVAQLFSPPRDRKALVRVAEVPAGQALKVIVLN